MRASPQPVLQGVTAEGPAPQEEKTKGVVSSEARTRPTGWHLQRSRLQLQTGELSTQSCSLPGKRVVTWYTHTYTAQIHTAQTHTESQTHTAQTHTQTHTAQTPIHIQTHTDTHTAQIHTDSHLHTHNLHREHVRGSGFRTKIRSDQKTLKLLGFDLKI